MRHASDVEYADFLGAQFCGFIFHPKSPRYIEPARAARLSTGKMLRVGIFVNQKADEIKKIMDVARLDMAQLHGNQDRACAFAIGGKRVIQVLFPGQMKSIAEVESQAHGYPCAWHLLDAGAGSGKCLNWQELSGISLPNPWFLAGGLGPDNLEDALALCTPDGLDINSGVELAPAYKSHGKMREIKNILSSHAKRMGEDSGPHHQELITVS